MPGLKNRLVPYIISSQIYQARDASSRFIAAFEAIDPDLAMEFQIEVRERLMQITDWLEGARANQTIGRGY